MIISRTLIGPYKVKNLPKMQVEVGSIEENLSKPLMIRLHYFALTIVNNVCSMNTQTSDPKDSLLKNYNILYCICGYHVQ